MLHQLEELVPEGKVWEADSGAEVLKLAAEEKLDIIFLDINLGDIQGTNLVKAFKKHATEYEDHICDGVFGICCGGF